MKFILDIDGVLVHANPARQVPLENDGFYKFNPPAIQALNSTIKINDEVVLSTSHRFRFSEDEWLKIFRSRGLNINHVSIIDTPLNFKRTRCEEIADWISANNIAPNDVVIIDDDKSLQGLPEYLKKRMVLTNSYSGLLDCTELEKLIR